MPKKNDVIKGITIEIGGDVSPLDKALAGVNAKSKSLQSQLRAVNQLLKFDPSNTDAIEEKQKLLAETLENSKEKLDMLRQAQEELEKQFHEGTLGKEEWDAFCTRVTYAEADVKKAEKAIRDFGQESTSSGKSVKGAGEDAEKAGKQAEQSGEDAKSGGNGWEKFGTLASKAGKIAIAGIATIGSAAAGAAAGVWKLSTDAGTAADDLITMSNKTGVAVETLQEWDYASRFVDVSVDKLTSSMAKQTKAMSQVSSTAGEAAVDLEKLEKAENKVNTASLAVQEAQLKYDAAVYKNGAASLEAQQAALALAKAQDTLTEAQKAVAETSVAVEPAANAMTQAYKRLGISVYDETGKMRDGQTVYWEVIDALGKIKNETERDQLAMQIFGESAQELNPLIKAGSDELQRLSQEAREAGLVLSEDTVADLGAFDDTMQRTKAQLQGIGRQLAVSFLPTVQSVGTGLQGMLSDIGTALADGFQPEDIRTIGENISKKLMEGIQSISKYLPAFMSTVSDILSQAVDLLVELIPTLLPPLTQAALSLLEGILDALSKNSKAIVDVLMQILKMALSFLASNLPAFVKAGLQIIAALTQGIADALPEIIQAIVDMIPELVQAVMDSLPLLIDAGIALLLALAQGLLDAIPQLIEALPTIIYSIVNGLLAAIPQIIDAGIQLLTALVAATPQIIQAIVKALPEIINGIMTALLGNIGKIAEAGVKLFASLVSSRDQIIKSIVKAFPQIWESCKQAVMIYYTKMAECGKNLIAGLWNGIKDSGAWLWDQISGFFGGITDNIKKLLGIHSPSTLFRDMIGKNLVRGIAVGFDLETPDLQKSIDKNLTDVTAGIRGTVDLENERINAQSESGGAFHFGGITFSIQNFYNSTDQDIRELTEEAMEAAEEYIRRRGGVFA